MELPIRFPHEGDKIYEQAVSFRRRSPTDRLLALVDLIACGMTLLKESPQRDVALRLRRAQEAEWQRIQKELFARHAR
jgi:hypothetical protein